MNMYFHLVVQHVVIMCKMLPCSWFLPCHCANFLICFVLEVVFITICVKYTYVTKIFSEYF